MTSAGRYLEFRETQAVGSIVDLDADQASAIAGTGLLIVEPRGEQRWMLCPKGNMVGAVRVGDQEVVVRPKAPFSSVLFMLAYARDPGIAPEEFEGSTDSDLWPLLAATLERLAGRALGGGVLQGYVERDDELTVVRGRIRVSDQIARHQDLPLPLEVRYDEYETDIPENRILRSALHWMSRVEGVPPVLRGGLRRLESRLAGAMLLRVGQPRPAWSRSRLNVRYVPALCLAELILDHLGLSTRRGDAPVASFVVDMAATFESFVAASATAGFTQILGHNRGMTHGQYRSFLDAERSQPIRPDIVHTGLDGAPDAVIDAKYKLIDDHPGHGPRLSDLYQMLAYCTVLELAHGTLVYAAGKGDTSAATLHIAGSDRTITCWPIDVSVPPRDLHRQVREALGAGC
ncbi:McrC family protein [Acidipropionibacterium acidipropionici]|uniref:McrC family protein n=1 Tax=Acidipropionibacterium acidipropionici TaxID=1748 RepID=UPI00110B4EA1|nr:restriction endonuclease [Acidipropionibacterium acidipropionici]QCV96229.1 restriction endonuclease [Acidipropionibacterium acidipropionici]